MTPTSRMQQIRKLHDSANKLNDVIKESNEMGLSIVLHCCEIPHGRPYVRVSLGLASLLVELEEVEQEGTQNQKEP